MEGEGEGEGEGEEKKRNLNKIRKRYIKRIDVAVAQAPPSYTVTSPQKNTLLLLLLFIVESSQIFLLGFFRFAKSIIEPYEFQFWVYWRPSNWLSQVMSCPLFQLRDDQANRFLHSLSLCPFLLLFFSSRPKILLSLLFPPFLFSLTISPFLWPLPSKGPLNFFLFNQCLLLFIPPYNNTITTIIYWQLRLSLDL